MAGHYFTTVENVITGKPVAGATILVYNAGATKVGDAITSGTLATIFSDDGITTVNQSTDPIVTDSRGFFEFWTDETSVDYEISYGGTAKFAVTDVEILGGSISSDVTALSIRVDAVEVVTQDPLVVSLAALSDPNADRILFWDDSANNLAFLTAGTGLSISGTTMTVDPLAAAGLTDPNADRIRFWDDSAGTEAWLTPSTGLSLSGTSITLDFGAASDVRTGTSTSKVVNPSNLYSAANFQTLTDGATITPDFGAGINFVVTLGGNRTLANPTNAKDGQSGVIRVIQDGTGSRTLAFGSNWRWAGGTKTISTAAGSIDVISYIVGEGGLIYATLSKAFAA